MMIRRSGSETISIPRRSRFYCVNNKIGSSDGTVVWASPVLEDARPVGELHRKPVACRTSCGTQMLQMS
jgi:hypothetical protein